MEDPFFATPQFLKAFTAPLADILGLKTLPLHIHEVYLAFFGYQLVFATFSPYLSRRFLPRIYNGLNRSRQINWDAHVTALLQCLITIVLSLWVLANDPLRLHSDWTSRLFAYSGAIGLVQAHAAGYFLWDLMASIRHYRVLGPGSLAHAVSALTVTLLGFRPFVNYYGLSFILYELSNPFMNMHWFFDKAGMTASRAQWINGVLLMSSFFMVRLVWGNYQSVLMYTDIWRALGEPSLAQILSGRVNTSVKGMPVHDSVPLWLSYTYVIGNTVLSFLNVFWFRIMVVTIRKRFEQKLPKEEGKKRS